MPTSRSVPILVAAGRRRLDVGAPAPGPLRSLGPRTVRRGAVLDVPTACEVLVVDRGVVLTTRGPGRHRLDPDDDLALADLLGSGRRRLHLPEVLVLDTGPLGPWAFHGPVRGGGAHPTGRPGHRDPAGEGHRPHVHGHIVARLADPRAVVTGLARQVDLRRPAALAHWLARQVLDALATAPRGRSAGGGGPGGGDPTASAGHAIAPGGADLREAVAVRLAGAGVALVDLGPLEVVTAGPVRTERHRCAERAARGRPGPDPARVALASPVTLRSGDVLEPRRSVHLGATAG